MRTATKALKQAVKRNPRRFPVDFMFELGETEFAEWRSQFVTSKADRMGLRYPPMAFTEQGVAMLSSVLNSQQAVEVNVAIMRAFVRLRKNRWATTVSAALNSITPGLNYRFNWWTRLRPASNADTRRTSFSRMA